MLNKKSILSQTIFIVLTYLGADFRKGILIHIVEQRNILKGTATLIITMFYMKDLNKPCILIPVSSKSGEMAEVVNGIILANGL